MTSDRNHDLIPLPFTTLFLRENRIIKGTGKSVELSSEMVELFRSVCVGGVTLDDLAKRSDAGDPEIVRRMMEMTDTIRFFSMDLSRNHEVIIIDQGYSGVTVGTLELWRRLNEKVNTLFVALMTPPFRDEEIENRSELANRKITFESLVGQGMIRAYISYYTLLRTLVTRSQPKLLLFTHRCEATYFFDIIRKIPTIIYSDFFHEEKFALARKLYGQSWPSEEETARLLEDIFYNIERGFLNTPSNHLSHLRASWHSLCAARENWCWSATETDALKQSSQQSNIRFVGPSVDLERLRDTDGKKRSKRVLFVSTMPNLQQKGLIHVTQALSALSEDTTVTLVTRIKVSDWYPDPDPRLDFRQSLSKSEVIELYHDSAVYVRVAEEDTLPLSLIEAMASGLPVVVSPQIQQNFPGIEDGVTGFVVSTQDPERVGEKVRFLLDNPSMAEQMGRECQKRVQSYSVGNHVDRIMNFIQ